MLSIISKIIQGENMDYSSEGYLRIRASSASGAFPVEGVSVRVKGSEENNVGIDYSYYTDKNGLTGLISLPAPSINYSLSPSASEKPYSNYTIEIFKDGYYPKKLIDAAIFAERTAILPVDLVPNAGLESNTAVPFSSMPMLIFENEELE